MCLSKNVPHGPSVRLWVRICVFGSICVLFSLCMYFWVCVPPLCLRACVWFNASFFWPTPLSCDFMRVLLNKYTCLDFLGVNLGLYVCILVHMYGACGFTFLSSI